VIDLPNAEANKQDEGSSVMKIVIQTQHRENYGAHDWDGKGECPQHWKMKGGNTYIVSEVSVEQSISELFWTQLETAIQSCDMYFEEYIVFSELIDNVDYVSGSYTEEWETPIYLEKDLFTEGFVALNKTINGEYGYMRKEVRCKYERWLQIDGEKKDYSSSFEFANGKILPYKESCDYLKELAA